MIYIFRAVTTPTGNNKYYLCGLQQHNTMNSPTQDLLQEVTAELEGNILPFWMTRMRDTENGGFIGKIDGRGATDRRAVKGAILNARILWTFSSAYRLLGKQEYLEAATAAKREIIDKFYDKEYGGIYWSIDSLGLEADTKKQFYAIGFAIYGLSEYSRATGDMEALEYAVRLVDCIEQHSFDKEKNGYIEACTRDWGEIEDMRLSDKDANERKTMNTHLHILEPYTALYRIWKDDRLERQLRNLIYIFTDKIMDSRTGHLRLFFDDDWNPQGDTVSYGHDIEASWLIWEAATVLGDKEICERVLGPVKMIAEAASEGFIPGQGMIYESETSKGKIDADRHWWVQAETVVGYYNLYSLTGDSSAFDKAVDCWKFIRAHITDHDGGEWFWSIKADGTVNTEDDKAGFWKCPYHNGRMCMEIIERNR